MRAELDRLRQQATARLSDLRASFADIVDSARDSNLDDEHDPEGTTIAASRAQVDALVRAAREQLGQIDAAESRLDAGHYGRCVRCGSVIPDGRLEARPATPDCVECAGRASGR